MGINHQVSFDQISESSGVSGNSESGGTVLGSSGSSIGAVAAAVTASGAHHSSLLLGVCRRGISVPMHNFLLLNWEMVVPQVWVPPLLGFQTSVIDCVFVIYIIGGSSQSFLALKRFPNIFPALGHGVPVWIGVSSSGGDLLSGVPSCEGA